jgi:hypothetical protein
MNHAIINMIYIYHVDIFMLVASTFRESFMPSWFFITNYGAVLVLVATCPTVTAKEIVSRLGITERTVPADYWQFGGRGISAAEPGRAGGSLPGEPGRSFAAPRNAGYSDKGPA